MRNDYGVGAALKISMNMIPQLARGTGRTTHMLNLLQDGDIVVVHNQQTCRLLERQIRERHVAAKMVICEPTPQGLLNREWQRHKCRVFFEHTWVEAYYLRAVDDLQRELFVLQDGVTASTAPEKPVSEKYVA